MEFEQRFKASGTGYCTVEDGIIYEFNPLLNGNKNRVGVTDAVYNELKAISDEYYKKLVELGAITPPKTPEQIQQETMELMSGMLTEIKAMKQVAGTLRLDLAQFRELAAFAQFASDLDKATKAQLDRGQRLTEVLKQGQYSPLSVEKQVMAIYLGTKGYLDDVAVKDVTRCEKEFLDFMEANHPEVGGDIIKTKKITDENEEALKKAIAEFKDTFVSEGR